MLCQSIISVKGKRLQILYLFIKIIIFDISAGFNQTKFKLKRKIIMMFDGNNENVLIIKVPKVDVRITWQTMETMIKFICP